MGKNKNSDTTIAENRKARYEYEVLETYEAGIQLAGTEVKSIREGRVNLMDSYGLIRNGEAWLLNAHIAPYKASGQYFNHEPRRTRKLLLHQKEINRLIGQVEQKGLTLIPLKMYFKGNWIKLLLGLCRGKKLYDKRETVKRRQDQRQIERVMKSY